MSRRFSIRFEATGGGVLVTVPELGTSTMAEDASIRAIEAAAQSLIDEHLRKTRKPGRKARAPGGYTPRHRDAS